MKKTIQFLFLCGLMLFSFSQSLIETGFLRNSVGQPITAVVNMQYKIFPSQTGGSALWDSGSLSVTVNEGLYNLYLGTPENPIDESVISSDTNYYFEYSVEGETFSSRALIGTTAKAIIANKALSVDWANITNKQLTFNLSDVSLVAATANYAFVSTTANFALSVLWNTITNMPSEFDPVSRSVYYLPSSWTPTWGQLGDIPSKLSYLGQKIEASEISEAVNTANALSDMNISQFSNDVGYLTTNIESDPFVKAYAKTINEENLIVGTANIALSAISLSNNNISQFTNDSFFVSSLNIVHTANYAATTPWSGISGKPAEYTPARGSEYYLPATWTPTWGQLSSIPANISYLGQTIEASEISEAVNSSKLANTANVALTVLDNSITNEKIVTINSSKIVGIAAPGVHSATHALGGGDELSLAISQIAGLSSSLSSKATLIHSHGGNDIVSINASVIWGSVPSADYASNTPWAGITDKPSEFVPANSSAYYLPDTWTPSWGQLSSIPTNISYLGQTIEASELSEAVNTANALSDMNISQFTNDVGYLTTNIESDPFVKAYAKTTNEADLVVGTANVALTVLDNSITNEKIITIDSSKIVGIAAPGVHSATHALGGSDELSLAISQIAGLSSSLSSKAALIHSHGGNDIVSINASVIWGSVPSADYASNTPWAGITDKPSEFVPANSSAYYLPDTWTPSWGQLSSIPTNISYLGQTIEAAELSEAVNTANALSNMNISQFTNDSSYLTSYSETDPLVKSYAKTKNEISLEVGTANVALSANYSVATPWAGITNKPSEFVPANSSAYYLPTTWTPSWGQLSSIPTNISYLGQTIEASELSEAVNTANALSNMNISQFTNDSSYLTSYSETDPLVKSYAKTKNEISLEVGTANVALTANSVNWININGRPNIVISGEIVETAHTANYAVTANALSNMNISQFTNDSSYLTSYSETDPLVKSYAKTKDEISLVVGTANVALSMNASGLLGDLVVKNGKVGIGTDSPTAKLEIEGNVSINGTITANAFVGEGSRLTGIAFYNKGTAQFTDDDTEQTFNLTFCTESSLIQIVVIGSTAPQGSWSVNTNNGSFTIQSNFAESADIEFNYYIVKTGE